MLTSTYNTKNIKLWEIGATAVACSVELLVTTLEDFYQSVQAPLALCFWSIFLLTYSERSRRMFHVFGLLYALWETRMVFLALDIGLMQTWFASIWEMNQWMGDLPLLTDALPFIYINLCFLRFANIIRCVIRYTKIFKVCHSKNNALA